MALNVYFCTKRTKNMILSFAISNYRSFKERTEFSMEATASQAKPENVASVQMRGKSIRVLKSSLIYGSNASGKTTVIRALHSLCSEINGMVTKKGGEGVTLYDPFVLDNESANKPSLMEVVFIAESKKYVYSISFDRYSFLDERLECYMNGKSKSTLFTRDTSKGVVHAPKYTSLKERPKFTVYPNKLIITKFLMDTPHPVIQPAVDFLSSIGFANSYSPRMKEVLWYEARELLRSNEYQSKLRRFLNYVDFGITDFKMPEDNKLENVMLTHKTSVDAEGNNMILMREESLGTSTLFLLGPKIIQALDFGTPLFVDELDSAFHSHISTFILRMFSSPRINPKNAQLIIVTHDVTLMREDSIRRDQIWFSEKNENGESDLFALSDFDGVRENTPFSKWYLLSKFGAVPSINDVEAVFDE